MMIEVLTTQTSPGAGLDLCSTATAQFCTHSLWHPLFFSQPIGNN